VELTGSEGLLLTGGPTRRENHSSVEARNVIDDRRL